MAPSLARPGPEVADVPRPPTLDAAYREHFRSVWRVLHRLGVPASQVDDATQDVFLVVHRKLDAFDGRAPLRSWIVAIAVRVASDYRRRAQRARGHELGDAIADAAPTPAEHSEMRESIRLLHSVLAELDETKRAVFVLSELEQLSVPEIADVLGVNLNTVYSRLRAARRQFDAALARRRGARGFPKALAVAGWDARASEGGNARWTFSKLGTLGSKLNVLAVCTAAVLGSGDSALEAARTDASAASTTAAAPSTQPLNEPAAAEPVPRARPQRAPKASTPLASKSPRRATPAPPPALGPELELLQRVQSALRGGNAALALSVLDAHQTDDRSLLAERQASRVVALCMLRLTSEARLAAREFFLQHPDSIHREAISKVCTNLQWIDEP